MFLETAARIQYGEIRELEKKLAGAEQAMEERRERGNAMVKEEVDAELIAEIVSSWTGIPVSKLVEGEREKLTRMEDGLRNRVVGNCPPESGRLKFCGIRTIAGC